MTNKKQQALLVMVFLFILLIVGVGIAVASSMPEPPEGCQISTRINWEFRWEKLYSWGGGDHDPPYDDFCGMAVRVDDVWYSNTEWGCPETIDETYSTNCLASSNGVNIWNRTIDTESGAVVRWIDVYSNLPIQEGIIWEAIANSKLSSNYVQYIPIIMNRVNYWGYIGTPPLPPVP